MRSSYAMTRTDYALGDIKVEAIYGNNVARGRAIAAQYDPKKVMCLAGPSTSPRGMADVCVGGPRLQSC